MMQKLLAGNKVFNAYRDILVLSAVIGYSNKAYKPVDKPASDGVLMQFFTETDYDLMDLIAYALIQRSKQFLKKMGSTKFLKRMLMEVSLFF